MSVRGVVGGVLGLVALQTLVQPAAADKTAGLFGLAATLMNRLLSADVAGIPNKAPAQEEVPNASTRVGPVVKSGLKSISNAPVNVNNGPNRAQ